ncbi:MAG: glutathione S-transferase family protein [Sphingomonadaceae bacterium]|nr:glutathione S-transferase family protein [Sphingomonadaceae bacterium]
MADFTFYTNPMSRGQIVRWALHEAGAHYQTVLVDWANRPAALAHANPMGKVPVIIHHAETGDHVVTEAAAICHYLAETVGRDLLPNDAERADYFRWFFFSAGPVEQAVTANAMGWQVPPEREGMAGFGSFERTMDTLDSMLESGDYVCGERFTMADVYVGSQIDWGLAFGSMPSRPSFEAYAERLRGREAYKAAKAIDMELIAEAQANG